MLQKKKIITASVWNTIYSCVLWGHIKNGKLDQLLIPSQCVMQKS